MSFPFLGSSDMGSFRKFMQIVFGILIGGFFCLEHEIKLHIRNARSKYLMRRIFKKIYAGLLFLDFFARSLNNKGYTIRH